MSRTDIHKIPNRRRAADGENQLKKKLKNSLIVIISTIDKMHLMYTLNEEGKRVYTLKKVNEKGEITKSAHPARFSPDDKFSRERVTLKKRFNLLPTQQGN